MNVEWGGGGQQQQQIRGMKVRTSVKKLCDGCKVFISSHLFPPFLFSLSHSSIFAISLFPLIPSSAFIHPTLWLLHSLLLLWDSYGIWACFCGKD